MSSPEQAPSPTGRVALVTGAANGIGAAIAERLGQDGHRILLLDRNPSVHDTARALEDRGCDVVGEVYDLADIAGIGDFTRRIAAREGRLDIDVNNAGISPKHDGKHAPMRDVGLAEWQSVLDINLTAAAFLIQAALPGMQERRWGRIINMASQAARAGSRVAGAHYAASKAGLIALSRCLAIETGSVGITVNCIAPGRIDTAMARTAGAAVNDAYARAIPVGRIGQPEEVADAVSFFAGDRAGFVTGTVLDVNGGHYMGG